MHDYQGRRVSQTVYSYTGSTWALDKTTTFVYDGWNVIKAQTTTHDNNGLEETTDYYVWGLNLSDTLQGPSALLRTGSGGVGGLLSKTHTSTSETFLYTFDANGNVGQLVPAAEGTIAAHDEYDPFGTLLVADGPEAHTNPFRFSTKYLDAETGLYYYGYRYYDPALGRWLTRDPIEETGGVNLYGFTGNNPVWRIDPWGLQTVFHPIEYRPFMVPPLSPEMSEMIEKSKEPECVSGIGECIARKAIGYVGQMINCADVAIKALIECAAEKQVPLTLPRIAHVRKDKWKCFRSKDYKTPAAFYNAAKLLNAGDLFRDDKITVPRDFKQLIPGDLISYDLGHHREHQRQRYTGHTRVVIKNGYSWFWRRYRVPSEIMGEPPVRYSRRLPGFVPSIEVVEGHMEIPVEQETYAYEQLLKEWRGPVKGKGRTWNCEIFKECVFTKECGP